jgi:hypothetical protein
MIFRQISNRKFRPRRKKPSAWKRVFWVLLVLVLVKVVYEVWSTDGKIVESLWFRFRAPSLTSSDLQTLEPSGFSVVSDEMSFDAPGLGGHEVDLHVDMPQVTYYGLVLSQSQVNQAVRNRIDKWFSLFVKEASVNTKNVEEGVSYRYKIKGDVVYFSRHILSIRLDIRQEFPQKKKFVDNVVIGIPDGAILRLRDIIKTDEASCMSLETFVLEQLYYRGVASEAVTFNCYNQPFILDAVGVTLSKLVASDEDDESVRITFSEYPDFFLPDGPVGSIVFP